jgi:hypothetical protein
MRNASRSRRLKQLRTAVAVMGFLPMAKAEADTLFDNASAAFANNFNSTGGTTATATYTVARVADTFIGGGYILPAGTADIYGFDPFPINGTSQTLSVVAITMYVWGSVNTTGTVNPSTPAFSNLLGTVTDFIDYSSVGGLPPGFFGTPGGATANGNGDPYGAFVLSKPIVLPNTTVGVTFNNQGSVDGGATFNSLQGLTSLIPYNVGPTVGTAIFNGFYRNGYNSGSGAIGSAETDGNFRSPLNTFNTSSGPLPNESGPMMRLYGDVGAITPDNWLSTAGGNWTDTTKWSRGAAPTPGIDAVFNLSSPSAYSVAIVALEYAANLRVQNDNVTLDLNSVPSTLLIGGALTVGVPATSGTAITGNLTIYNSGRLTDDTGAPIIPVTEAGSIVVGGNGGTGTLTVSTLTYLYSDSSTTIGAGSSLIIPSAGVGTGKFGTDTLSIAGTTNAWLGKLDIGIASVNLRDGDLATVTNQLKTGFNNGKWNGQGITSSAAQADTTHLTAIGAILNNDGTGNPIWGTGTALGAFNGDNPTPGLTSVLLRYTYYGDTNLDGQVDGTDYSRIDNGFINHLTGWYNGDFNYDGVVNGSDYTLIDNAFNTQGLNLVTNPGSPPSALGTATGGGIIGGISSGDATSSMRAFPADPTVSVTAQIAGTSVPEPTSLGLLALAAGPMLSRRSRRLRKPS